MVAVRTARLEQADGARWSLTTRPDASGTSWIVDDVAGWYGGSGVRGEVVAGLGHGDFVERGYREGRVLTLHGTVICESSDERDWQERNLSGMAWSGEWATLTCDDGNAELSARVRLDGAPQIVKMGTRALQFQLPLRADTPFIHGAWRESTLEPIGTGVGVDYPLFNHYPDARVNLVANHSFEDGLDGWTGFRADIARVPSGDGYVVRVTSTSDTATSSLLETGNGTGGHPVTPGDTLTVSYDVLEDSDISIDSLAYFYDADGEFMWNTASADTAVKGGEVTRPVVAFAVPEGAAFLRLLLARAVRPAGGFADVDRVSVEAGPEATSGGYFGAIQGEPIFTFGTAVDTTEYVWNDGNAEAWPEFMVYADAPGGFAVSLGDRRVTFPWPTFPDMPVTVDMSGSISVSGVDQSHMVGERGWAMVAPGSIESPSLAFLQGGTGWATVRHRDSYI